MPAGTASISSSGPLLTIQFQIQPYGYARKTDYRNYIGDGTPAGRFLPSSRPLWLPGNYGDHYQFGLLVDAAASSGAIIRDIYLNAKYNNALQLQAGQFKEPFAQELAAGVTNIDFVERGLQSLLYPSAASAFRSPGVAIHGDGDVVAFQYWAGAFNGKGYATNNTTSVPEAVGWGPRFYPWRSKKDSVLQGWHSAARSLTVSQTLRGLSGRTHARNRFRPTRRSPSCRSSLTNGNVWRYEGEFTYLKGPWGFRDEYVQA
jgi:hypothetical protein